MVTTRATTTRSTLRAQWLGQHLRQVREEAGLTLRDIGDYIQRNATTVSRIESGVLPARVTEVLAYLDLAGVDNANRRAMLRQLAQDVWQKGWWDGYSNSDDVAAVLINRAWLEARADRLCAYETNVPGLLQTDQYAKAIIEAEDPDASEEQVARFVEVRMKRQQILNRAEPVELRAILDEAVLRRPAGSREITREQFQRLAEFADQPHIQLRVLPFSAGAHPGLEGQFVVIELPEPYPEVGYVDNPAGAVFAEGEKAERLRRKYDRLCAVALDVDASTALIVKAAEDLE